MGDRLTVLAAIAFVFFSPGSASFAKDNPAKTVNPSYRDFDPAKCAPPVTDGKIRVSFGSRVLAWPFDRITFNSP